MSIFFIPILGKVAIIESITRSDNGFLHLFASENPYLRAWSNLDKLSIPALINTFLMELVISGVCLIEGYLMAKYPPNNAPIATARASLGFLAICFIASEINMPPKPVSRSYL
jgi:hypothetical protein